MLCKVSIQVSHWLMPRINSDELTQYFRLCNCAQPYAVYFHVKSLQFSVPWRRTRDDAHAQGQCSQLFPSHKQLGLTVSLPDVRSRFRGRLLLAVVSAVPWTKRRSVSKLIRKFEYFTPAGACGVNTAYKTSSWQIMYAANSSADGNYQTVCVNA